MIKDFLLLVKIRITLLVMVTSYLGYYLGLRYIDLVMIESESLFIFLHLLIGVFFTSSASSIFNQCYEVHLDILMLRTKNRPLPSKRMNKNKALLLAVVFSLFGIIYLFYMVNPLTSLISFLNHKCNIIIE